MNAGMEMLLIAGFSPPLGQVSGFELLRPGGIPAAPDR